MILINSVLASLPTYFLSLLMIPATIEKKTEQCQRDVLYDKGNKGDGMHLVAWEDICKPKYLGGLGIKWIRDMNKALFTKWTWRFG